MSRQTMTAHVNDVGDVLGAYIASHSESRGVAAEGLPPASVAVGE